MKSQLRRYTKLGTMAENTENVFRTGGLAVDDDKKQVTVDGENIRLTPMEFNILCFLVRNAGKVYSIEQIYESIWNEEAIGADNTVDRTYPPYPGENRNQSERATLPEGSMGCRI